MTCSNKTRRTIAVTVVAVSAYYLWFLIFYWSPPAISPIWGGKIQQKKPKPAAVFKHVPICSVDVIRKYCIEHNYFPTGGRWVNSTFLPDACHLPFRDIPKEYLRECLTRRNITKLVVLGDSNGLRYLNSLKRLLEKSMKCRTVKVESNLTIPDVNYFTEGTNLMASDIVVHHRDCSGCRSKTESCSDGSLKLNIEYITMEFFQDTEVTTVRNRWQVNCPHESPQGCHQSNTNQEFILSEYLVGNYPDVILLFSSSHDKSRYEQNKVRAYIDYLKMLISMYVPNRTQVFWFSKISENLQKKPKIWINVSFDGKYNTNEQIERLNRELFDVLRPEFTIKDGKISTFFDIYDMSLGVPEWSLDGVHLKSQWYDVVLSNWFQTFCAN
ncbi:hypothetical protein LSAT2_030907 [Lamellibrachia satsuma]|nr:hypothetical protein LSAT2_030907 [Lamellibrachia satsuma]